MLPLALPLPLVLVHASVRVFALPFFVASAFALVVGPVGMALFFAFGSAGLRSDMTGVSQ